MGILNSEIFKILMTKGNHQTTFFNLIYNKGIIKSMKKLTTQEQEIQFKKIHGDKYEYDWSTYVNNSEKMTIICGEHGVFEQKPNHHKSGIGCPKCGKIKSIESKTLTFKEVEDQCNKVHNFKYTYHEESYTNTQRKMKIGCPIHGIFEQTPNDHKNGQGCRKCGEIKTAQSKTLTFEEQVIRCNKVHNNKYIYYKESYIDNSTKMSIGCPTHGIFEQTPNNHKNGNGCPICNSSKGELEINKFLTSRHNFKTQHKIEGCKHKGQLIFDFYISELNTCIEFDGEQHFRFVEYYHRTIEGFKEQQLKDKIKNEYCLNNNIRLIRIPYTEFYNIESILERELYANE